MTENDDQSVAKKEENLTQEDIQLPEASFTQIMAFLQIPAMQHLGILPNPMDQKVELNLPWAKMFIDLLSILQEKTKGNLTDEEKKTMEEALYNLRMVYVNKVNEKKEKK